MFIIPSIEEFFSISFVIYFCIRLQECELEFHASRKSIEVNYRFMNEIKR